MSSQTAASKPLRVAFETLGCRSNYADTIDIQAGLAEAGAVPCDFHTGADVYVINTCSVTDHADQQALRLIERARELAPDARIVVTGCFAEVGKEILESSGLVDSVIGPGRRREVLDSIFAESTKAIATEPKDPSLTQIGSKGDVFVPRDRKSRAQSISLDAPMSGAVPGPGERLGEVETRSRYHLRIQEGCDNFCTFCIIPFTRGHLVSRPKSQILADLEQLHSRGFSEVVLTGTHIGGYGEDCGTTLTELMYAIATHSPIQRVRLTSIDPNDVSDELLELFLSNPKFCEHLHLCIQAFSDPILKRMNRRYRLSLVEELIDKIRSRAPRLCIGSDLIMGFPGESREDVEQQISWFERSTLNYLHVFPYSERSGTSATQLPESVPLGERRRRAARMRALSERRWNEYLGQFVGTELEVVVEGIDDAEVRGTAREFIPISLTKNVSLQTVVRGSIIRAKAEAFDEKTGVLQCG